MGVFVVTPKKACSSSKVMSNVFLSRSLSSLLDLFDIKAPSTSEIRKITAQSTVQVIILFSLTPVQGPLDSDQSQLADLSEPVDIFAEWIDAIDAQSKQKEKALQRRKEERRKRDVNDDDDDDKEERKEDESVDEDAEEEEEEEEEDDEE
ncbi:hypothetical protein PSACC_01474 [Paramicrosporidium saccamoebae]|uniref:Uncharacterized protein n=1 Tax=Paramicrosporidium saccamoebae TaxID=1246581 RepID=A0A2H9TLU4_9FUNG|nr:hypothetical protein PSACC_01474 [Paramicrosporidium saccamoebae]